MAVQITIDCDECGRVIDGGKSAKEIRDGIRKAGGRVALPGGRDICPWCVSGESQPAWSTR